MQFFSDEDANNRLAQNLIQVDGKNVFIDHVSRKPEGPIAVGYLPEEKLVSYPVNLDKVYIYPPKFDLGYVNYFYNKKLYVAWTERLPRRSRPMGLNENNLKVTTIDDASGEIQINRYKLLTNPGLMNTINGVFPSMEQGMKYINGFAFSRDFALQRTSLKNYSLYYMTRKVGEFDKKEFCLYPPFAYLKEHLQRTLLEKGESHVITVAEAESE